MLAAVIILVLLTHADVGVYVHDSDDDDDDDDDDEDDDDEGEGMVMVIVMVMTMMMMLMMLKMMLVMLQKMMMMMLLMMMMMMTMAMAMMAMVMVVTTSLFMYGIPSMKLDKIDKAAADGSPLAGLEFDARSLELWGVRPVKVLRRIKLMQQEGITFKCNTEVGKDVTLNGLCSQNDAVIMATGATMWREMRNTDGRNLKNVVQDTQRKNLDTEQGLKNTNVPTYDLQGKRVVVIGGGDTAVDCVATSIRLGAKSVLQFSRRDAAPKDRPKHTPWPCWADTYRVDYAHSEGQSTLGRDPREYMVQTKSFRPSSQDPSAVGGVIASKLNPSGKAWQRDLLNCEVSTIGWTRTKKNIEETGTVDYPAELVVLAMGFTGPDNAIDPQNQPKSQRGSAYVLLS
ncbi:Glutamate synthase [NADH] [Symbiodinium microadriaticum]|uniref:Glutamate synthase [NADH] n=1 Tax=Symbiodinium microadriaticum TaxID=2951 RepID=A0A1Q9F114_SYMMI|nr:Glutamate synthase [NADH] [Symbiodinium microadriaticum]